MLTRPSLPLVVLAIAAALLVHAPGRSRGQDAAARPSPWVFVQRHPGDGEIFKQLVKELEEYPEIRFIVQDRVDAKLRELQLGAGQSFTAADLVRVGTSLEAALVLFVERQPREPKRVLIVEPQAGVRLADFQLLHPTSDASAGLLPQHLLAVSQTLRKPRAGWRWVAVGELKAAEPDSEAQAQAGALALSIERDLQRIPDLLVVHPSEVERLAKAPAGGERKPAPPVVETLEISLRRSADQPRTGAVTVRSRSSSNAAPLSVTAELETASDAATRRAIVTAVQSLGGQRNPAPLEIRGDLEVPLLVAYRDWFRQQRQHGPAAHFADAVLGLSPSLGNLEAAAYLYYQYGQESGRETKRTQPLLIATRAHAIELQRIRKQLEERPDAPVRVTSAMHPHVTWRSIEDAPTQKLRTRLDDVRREKYALLLATARRQGRPAADLLIDRLNFSVYFSATPAEFCADVQSLLRELGNEHLPGAEKADLGSFNSTRFNSALSNQLEWALASETWLERGRGWTIESIRPLLETLEQSDLPAARMASLSRQALLDGEDGLRVSQRLLEMALAPVPKGQPIAKGVGAAYRHAVGRLQQAQRLAPGVQAILDEAAKDDPPLFRSPPVTALLFTSVEPAQAKAWYEQMAAAAKERPELQERLQAALLELPLGKRLELAPSAFSRQTGPWASYEITEISIAGPKRQSGNTLVSTYLDAALDSVGRDGHLYALYNRGISSSEPGNFQSRFEVVKLRRTAGKWDKLEPVALDGQQAGSFTMPSSLQPLLIAAPFGLLAGTSSSGVAQATPKATRFFALPLADGVKADSVTQAAWLKDRLYVALKVRDYSNLVEHFAVLNPPGSELKEIPIPRETKRSTSSLFITGLVSDSRRECLWLAIDDRGGGSGLWKYRPDDGQFERVLKAQLFGLAWTDRGLLLRQRDHWELFDPQKQEARKLEGYAMPPLSTVAELQSRSIPSPAQFVVMVGEHIIDVRRQLYLPDGTVHPLLDDEWPWSSLHRLDQGFIAVSRARVRDNHTTGGENRFWLVQPKPLAAKAAAENP